MCAVDRRRARPTMFQPREVALSTLTFVEHVKLEVHQPSICVRRMLSAHGYSYTIFLHIPQAHPSANEAMMTDCTFRQMPNPNKANAIRAESNIKDQLIEDADPCLNR